MTVATPTRPLAPTPTARRARAPSRLRVVAVVTGVCAAIAALGLAGRALAPLGGPLAVGLSVVAGGAGMLLAASLVEWFVHGRIMHGRSRWPLLRRIYDLHHRAHHWGHYPPDAYVRDEVTYVPFLPYEPERACRTRLETAVAAAAQVVFYGTFALPIVALAWVSTGNAPFVAACLAVSALVVGLALHVHDSVHCPGHSPLERFGWFRALDRHHYVHHIDTGANVNFLLPLGDWLLGTLRVELTDRERARWPAWNEARVVKPRTGAIVRYELP